MSDSRFIGVVTVTLVASCLSTPPPAVEIDASQACASGLDGTFERTRTASTGFVGLVPGETSGYFTSRVFPAPPDGRFRTIHWETVRPSLKALPDDRMREDGYLQGGADLATNELLFHFDDPPAWDDSSGNDLSGSCLSTPASQCPAIVPGLFRDALEFDVDAEGGDNDNDRIRIVNHAALETPQITLEVWVKPNRIPVPGARMMVVHKGTATPATPPYATYSIEYNNSRTFRCYAHVDAAGEELIDGTRVSAENQWHHVACTYDGLALRMFVDGYPDGELPAVGALAYNLTGSPDVILGDYSGSQFFDGHVDELAVHRTALAPAVIQERARRGALRLAWQVRVCDDAACDGEDDAWVGPTGTAASFYTEACSTERGHPTLQLSDLDCDGDGNPDDGADLAVPAGAFYQARALLDSHRAGDTPELTALELCQ
jgi:hypothetical protein